MFSLYFSSRDDDGDNDNSDKPGAVLSAFISTNLIQPIIQWYW